MIISLLTGLGRFRVHLFRTLVVSNSTTRFSNDENESLKTHPWNQCDINGFQKGRRKCLLGAGQRKGIVDREQHSKVFIPATGFAGNTLAGVWRHPVKYEEKYNRLYVCNTKICFQHNNIYYSLFKVKALLNTHSIPEYRLMWYNYKVLINGVC